MTVRKMKVVVTSKKKQQLSLATLPGYLVDNPTDAKMLRNVKECILRASAKDTVKIASIFASHIARHNALHVFKTVLTEIEYPFKTLVSKRLREPKKKPYTKEIARLFLLSSDRDNLNFRKAIELCLKGVKDLKGWNEPTEVEAVIAEFEAMDIQTASPKDIEQKLKSFSELKQIKSSRNVLTHQFHQNLLAVYELKNTDLTIAYMNASFRTLNIS